MHRLIIALIAALVLAPSASHGQVTAGQVLQAQGVIGATNTIATPMRLSDWLLDQAIDPNAYPLGLSWRVPGEVPAQAELRLELLRSLSGLDREVKANSEVLQRLRDWVSGLPVTGRVRVAVADARWLQGSVARDPMLQPGHSVVLPRRPSTVTVITARGTRCAVTHAAGNEAMAYVQSCASPDSGRTDWFWASRPDWVWVAQPDGRVQRFGAAAWNSEDQDEPAPGAWIWAPPWNGGFSEQFSQQLVTFLATQGSAVDPVGGTAPTVKQIPRVATRNDSTVVAGRTSLGDPFSAKGTNPSEGAAPTSLGGSSQAWTTSGLPELGAAEATALDASREAVLPPPIPMTRSRGIATTASDWGGVGLLQTPTARMREAGNLSVNFSRIYPYSQTNIMVQPLDWLEAGFRYTNVSNRLYSPYASFSGDQAYKDKSFDAKFRLWTESAYVPQVAIGFRDFAGTGLFSGEYLVASKRTGPLDWSLGMGWGNVGARGNLRNPLGRLIPSFDTRKTDTGQGGSFAFGSYFNGPAALFGGVQYQTPWEPLILKLEYDGNDYQHEGLNNVLRKSSPWNFGAVYRAGRAVDVTLGVERGNTAMLGITLHTQLDGLSVPKPNDPPRVPVALIRPQRAPDWSATGRDIATQTDWHVRRIEQRGRELRVTLDDAQSIYWRERADRAAAVLNRDAPASVDRFALTYRQRGVDVAEHVIERDAWVAAQTQPLPPREERATLIARAPETLPPGNPLYDDARPRFETSLGPNYQQTLGGPDSFLLFQVGVVGNAKMRLRDDTWLQGTVQVGLYDNYDKFNVTGPSNLPRVRTYLREYVTTSQITIPNLQATHVGRLSGNQYYSVYAGYLEPYFGGIGAEWLYRPFASRIALGVDANLVKQRSFEQDLSFDKAGDQTGYRVATGHATLYWDTGWNGVQANLSVGRYLAKDLGVTVDLSRTFDNGVKFGAFFSKTNVSAEQFGEGSFDKGVYLSVPFDAFLTRSSNGTAAAVWKPLTRDGGAKLARFVPLYDITRARDDRALRFKAAPPRNEESIPADRRDSWSPPSKGAEPYTRVVPQPETGQWTADAQGYEQRLVEALYRQRFRNIRVAYDASRQLTVEASNDAIHPASRAVGRAARTALHLGPLDMREIRIEFAQGADPAVTYDFADLKRLQRYFDGEINAAQLADSVAVDYRDPAAREADPLARLDDTETRVEEPRLADVLRPVTRPFQRVARDFATAGRTAADMDWLRMGAIGGGLFLTSSALDRRADQFAQDHGQNRYVKAGNSFGNALPWLAIAGAGAAALDGSDPVRSRTGYAALEAGGTAFLAVTGLKTVFGRARPGNELGNHAFKPFSTASGYDSLPSGHTIITWAVATPFAEEYDAPWLYGFAAVTNLARVGSRNHWLSDTVAGSALGYAIGRVFWESSRKPQKGTPRVLVHPSGVNLAWTFN
ncbi:MAG: YjbH domain-containing protein [Burkholderiales bacterium]|nr:YjbH domain-containing protein [Burkholderiales bacterium]